MTKALHPKRPALIPMLDSVVQAYLAGDDPGPRSSASFGERATALVRGYEGGLDRNRTALHEIRRQLARRGHRLTEVRILDIGDLVRVSEVSAAATDMAGAANCGSRRTPKKGVHGGNMVSPVPSSGGRI